MKQSILLLLLCSLLLTLAACKEESPPLPVISVEEQRDAKYLAYQRSTADFFGDFASRYRQVHVILQQDYNFEQFYYFSDDLQNLQQSLQQTLAMPAEHALDKPALDYLNAINALLPLDKKISDYSNNQGWKKDGGASISALCRQLLPLLKQASQAQQAFSIALQQIEDKQLWDTLHKYKEGSLQRYRLTALYYGRRIHQDFMDWFTAYDNQENSNEQRMIIQKQLEQNIIAFDKNAKNYIANMPEKDSCSIFMNNLIDFVGESRALLSKFVQGSYTGTKKGNLNTLFIRRNNDRLILKRNYLKVIASYNQGDC